MSSFTVEKKTTEAYWPRRPGSTVLADDKLTIVYNKFKTTASIPSNAVRYNLIFAHGTGMNKAIWTYIIKKLYEYSQNSNGKWYLDSCLAFDAVSHGDSAIINQGKIGWVYQWEEGGKDLLKVLKHEMHTTGDFQNNLTSRNIAIGHSLGGYGVVLAGFYDPNVLDSIIPIEGVLYSDDKSLTRFTKLFSKIGSLLMDTFDSERDFNDYYRVYSFYKTIHPEVMNDFLQDELITVVENGETKYKSKTPTNAQMASYLGSTLSLKLVMSLYPWLRVPVCHVIGSEAKWNPPETAPYVRSTIPKKYLSATYDIPKGEHLVHAEQPDYTSKIIEEFILKRQVDFESEKVTSYSELKNGTDRNKLKEIEFGNLLTGNFAKVSGYADSIFSKF
ncbi:Alpha/Beta hydrolase protein [Scheffersomyces amazonensis]|uniref:Alpha/Beta hydrolase protein n=1 Tax=Scheffersomyces amazonensis TaxID=1078765 RepID=UPI00315DB712